MDRERPRSDRFVIKSTRGVMPIHQRRDHEEWFHNCINSTIPPGDEGVDMLQEESTSNGVRMESAFNEGMRMYRRRQQDGLTKPERVVVIMFTLQNPEFYRDFNEDCSSGRWRQYRVFSTLLFSACRMLAEMDPVRQPVYRGVHSVDRSFDSTSFFWPQFSSASLIESVANKFSPYVQEFSICQYGAKLKNLSAYPKEQEVLILPFEAFVRNLRSRGAVYRSAVVQPLMTKLCEVGEMTDASQRGNQEVEYSHVGVGHNYCRGNGYGLVNLWRPQVWNLEGPSGHYQLKDNF